MGFIRQRLCGRREPKSTSARPPRAERPPDAAAQDLDGLMAHRGGRGHAIKGWPSRTHRRRRGSLRADRTLQDLTRMAGEIGRSPVLTPTDDVAAMVVDDNAEVLRERFGVPLRPGRPGPAGCPTSGRCVPRPGKRACPFPWSRSRTTSPDLPIPYGKKASRCTSGEGPARVSTRSCGRTRRSSGTPCSPGRPGG